jgi:hexosaminidase
MPEALQSRVLGGGCQMWSEWIPTVEAMNRQVFPRLAAYAEDFWTPARKKDASRFTRDLQPWLDRWTTLGYYTE